MCAVSLVSGGLRILREEIGPGRTDSVAYFALYTSFSVSHLTADQAENRTIYAVCVSVPLTVLEDYVVVNTHETVELAVATFNLLIGVCVEGRAVADHNGVRSWQHIVQSRRQNLGQGKAKTPGHSPAGQPTFVWSLALIHGVQNPRAPEIC